MFKRHNTRYIEINTYLYRACWTCVETCPQGVIGKIDILFHRHARIDHAERCQGCGACVKECPRKAIILINADKADMR